MLSFIRTNGTVLAIASMQYVALLHSNWYSLFTFSTIRNFTLIYLIDSSPSEPVDDIYFTPYVLQGAAVEAATLMLLPKLHTSYILKTLVFFIPVSFGFEVINDFFHYWVHRTMHMMHDPFHKTHHHFVHVKPIVAFYQNIIDLVLSNSLPFLVTSYIISMAYPLSVLDMALILTYKTFLEVAGHLAVSSNKTSCFPQFIWLPRMLGIELYSDDHALHHTNSSCNYSKRFSLWDKVFGTFFSKKNTRTN
uniref:Fatty acid hydroxylase domain-containing protein n=1 Tax=viral metagenome TaxID=1070528 RepID=A0A6C0ENU1_9ZZZZ